MELKVKVVDRDRGLIEELYLPAILAGLRITVRHFMRNIFGKRDVVTISYPEEQRRISPRYRGRHRLTVREDGFIKCVACYMCEEICPAHCIHIDAGEHQEEYLSGVVKEVLFLRDQGKILMTLDNDTAVYLSQIVSVKAAEPQ